MKKTFSLVLMISFLLHFSFAQTLEAAFSKSYTLEQQQKFGEAIAALKSFYDENNYELNLRLGYLENNAQQYTEAEKYYAKAVTLKPVSIEAKLGYVMPLSALGNWNKVGEVYDEILKIDPQNTYVNYRRGTMFYYNKDYKAALPYFEKVVNLYPFDYDGLLMLAWTNLLLGKNTEAKYFFNKVLLRSPNDASAKEGLSKVK